MNNFGVVSSVYRGVWAIHQETALSYLPSIENLLNKGNVDVNQKNDVRPISLEGSTIARYDRYEYGFSKAEKGSVAVIDVCGPLMKYDQDCGPMGTASIANIIREADKSDRISSIVLIIDTPGGTVDGTETLAETIRNTKKKVVGYIDGMMCSAGLWIGTSCDVLIASTEMDSIGSIGVMMTFADLEPYYERLGVKFHTILSNYSGDKNKEYEKLKKGEYEAYKKDVLDPIAERFIATVKKYRPNATEEQFTGKVYFAKDVVGTLIDGIGSLEMAIKTSLNQANVALYKKNNQLATNKEEKGAASSKDKISINNKISNMTVDQLKAENPSLYNEIFNAGKTEGTKQERDRVGAYMVFVESSPEAVAKGIESGNQMSAKEMAELSMAATKKMLVNEEAKGNNEAVNTGAAPKVTEEVSNQASQDINAAFAKIGVNLEKE